MKQGDTVLYENEEYVVLFTYKSGFCEVVKKRYMFDYRVREVKLVDQKSLVIKHSTD